jgi:DNA-binding transcriptional ArsR family regulator
VNIARIFHSPGDSTRRAIVERIGAGPVLVSQLAAPPGIGISAVGQYLQLLEHAGLVRTEKPGRVRTCSLNPTGLALAKQWIEDRRSEWDRRLDSLGELLAE